MERSKRFTALARALPFMLFAWSPAAFAHEHMYVGSDHPGHGALVLRYDFNRHFPLVPQPGTAEYLGTDPAFNAQVVDDPGGGIYRLRNGTRIRMEITALDPGVSVNFNGVKLTKAGDTALVGHMPYLHQHPQWTLNVPPGVYGDHHLSFRVRAVAGYAPSASYTATLTNAPPETTTTLPAVPGSCTVAGCQDMEPCTVDTCQADGCHHDAATGTEAVRCRLAKLQAEMDDVRPSSRAGQRFMARLYKIVNIVEHALNDATTGGPKTSRLVKRAQVQMNRFAAVVDRGVRRKVIGDVDGDALRTLAGDAYDQLVLLGS